jgi:hypothetical protein
VGNSNKNRKNSKNKNSILQKAKKGLFLFQVHKCYFLCIFISKKKVKIVFSIKNKYRTKKVFRLQNLKYFFQSLRLFSLKKEQEKKCASFFSFS